MNEKKQIKDLKERNNSLRNQLEYKTIRVDVLEARTKEQEKKIDKLNNIINELDNWLDDEINRLKFEDNYESADTLEIVQETLQELKGVDKE